MEWDEAEKGLSQLYLTQVGPLAAKYLHVPLLLRSVLGARRIWAGAAVGSWPGEGGVEPGMPPPLGARQARDARSQGAGPGPSRSQG